MRRILLILSGMATPRRAAWAVAGLVLAVGFAGCKDATEPIPETGIDYYPVAVGNFRVYAVADSTWNQATMTAPSTVVASSYQFKETITEIFTDAAGQKAYRVVRSKLLPPATAWRDDSVFVLSATAQSVVLNRNNTRTVELVFPVREGRSWNFNAYNNNFNDTITAETRRYSRVGQPFATGGGATGLPVASYPVTLTTTNTGVASENTLVKTLSYQQVFAKGVGPVFRRRLYFLPYTYTNQATGNQIYPANSYFSGFSRRETLIDYGPR